MYSNEIRKKRRPILDGDAGTLVTSNLRVDFFVISHVLLLKIGRVSQNGRSKKDP